MNWRNIDPTLSRSDRIVYDMGMRMKYVNVITQDIHLSSSRGAKYCLPYLTYWHSMNRVIKFGTKEEFIDLIKRHETEDNTATAGLSN